MLGPSFQIRRPRCRSSAGDSTIAIDSSVGRPASRVSRQIGPTAVGFDAGVYLPTQSEFDNALIINALLEYYLTPRVSLRTNFGLPDPGLGESSDSLRQIPLRLDVNYNREGGKWHPFVGAGVGACFLQVKDNGKAFGESETKAGFNVGGGVEYFTGRTVSIKGEAGYHKVGDTRTGQDPSGFVFTGGLKTYW